MADTTHRGCNCGRGRRMETPRNPNQLPSNGDGADPLVVLKGLIFMNTMFLFSLFCMIHVVVDFL